MYVASLLPIFCVSSLHIYYVALVAVSNVNVSDEPVTSSEFTLTWMDISMLSQKFSHYTVFYLPLSGPYSPIMTSQGRIQGRVIGVK